MNPQNQPAPPARTSTHVLRTSARVTVTAHFDEAAPYWRCTWDPPPPYAPAKARRVIKEYEPWRNRILEEFAKRTGQKITVVNY